MPLEMGPDRVQPLSHDELAEVAIFPLPGVVLYPGMALPLHVFEPRYRAMMRWCLESGRDALVMAMIQTGHERQAGGDPPLCEVAGVGRIMAHRENADGTFDLLVIGAGRARIQELPRDEHAFRRARLRPLEDELDVALDLGPLLSLASQLESADALETSSVGARRDPGMLMDALTARFVRSGARRQQILEATSLRERLGLVRSALTDVLAHARLLTPRERSAPN
jgi:uncharacterized protein